MTGSRKYARIAAASCGLFLTYEKKKMRFRYTGIIHSESYVDGLDAYFEH